jgi:4-amino-4-deoxy-L-arabinose transferase-like glycosyltransferase
MKNRLLLIIIFLAAAVRFINLNQLPPALNRDEAAIGWNAYSILKTGRDEHGQFLPLAFKSIGDYKMPLYIYASTIPVALFGLNDFSIRFWSAIAGVVSVIAIYYLTQELVKKRSVALLAAALLAFNPWAVFYSRIGFEANLSLAFFLTGLYLLLKGLGKTVWLYVGLAVFLLAFLTYSSSLIFIPLFLAVFILVWRQKLLRPAAIIAWLIFALAGALIFKNLWTVSAQKSNITVFSDPSILDYYHTTRSRIFQENPFLARTWWNKEVFMARLVAGNYLKTFSPEFLVIKGGNHPWHKIPGVGNFYWLEIVLAVIGLYWLIKKSRCRYLQIIVVAWLLLAPLPSAITVDAPHSTRSLHLLPVVLLLAGFGLSVIWRQLKHKQWLIGLLALIYLTNLGYAGYRYWLTYPRQFPQSLPLGLKQAIQFVDQQNLQGKIYLTDIHASTYLYPLVYTQFDPRRFQEEAVWTKPDIVGLSNAISFGNFIIVDDLKDIRDAKAVILPQAKEYSGQPVFSAGNFRVYLNSL